MNYQKHYDLLMARAMARSRPDGYVEKHHILPRCLGGTDEPSNIVCLTYDEHCLAHLLLLKLHPDHLGLALATMYMVFALPSRKKIARRQRTWAKLRWISLISEFSKNRTPEHRQRLIDSRKLKIDEISAKISAKLKGRPLSEQTKQKLSASHTGKKLSAEHVQKISNSNRGKKRTDEARAKMSAAMTGKRKSEEHRRKIGLSGLGRKHSPEVSAKLSALFKGIPRSEEVKQKIRDTKRRNKEKEATC